MSMSIDTKTPGGSLGRRVAQIVQQPLDDTQVRMSLESLAHCYSDTNLTSLLWHRDLRAKMHMSSTALDRDFVQALGQVDNMFAQLEAHIELVDQECRSLRTQVNRALNSTQWLTAQASTLFDEQRELHTRLQLTREFIERFGVPDAVEENSPAAPQFFVTLDLVAEKRAECQKLLAVRSQTAAELLVALAELEDRLYGCLSRWVVSQVRELNGVLFSDQLKYAMSRLRTSQPLFFDHALKEIAKARRTVLHREFHHALSGSSRPIEAHAADPLRYIGDMLAWIHQACAEERELLDTLITADNKVLLGSALEQIARPLEIRVEQTTAGMAPSSLYRVDNLLVFYFGLFLPICDPDSVFITTLRSLCASTHETLRLELERLVDNIIVDIERLLSPTLDVPPSLGDFLGVVADILILHEDSLTSVDASGPLLGNTHALVVVDDITELLTRIRDEAHTAAHGNQRLREYERTIFELNIVTTIETLVPRAGAHAMESAPLVDKLSKQLSDVLREKSTLPFGLPIDDIGESLVVFNERLKTDLDVARLVSRLRSHQAAREVTTKTIQLFVEQYRELYERAVEDVEDNDEIVALLHTPETVATLL
ncbi:Golgi transport complex subunit 6 [Coemansia spiralis]|uniref:Conserved oligomeric Golgi complex subunit 6 n=2 Tax=Coemansia TaxID=4863 RepID=A0A9W8G5P5_9FUNG|nr:Golgi transport complex subunit 6 [Coemansia umbellata]KAJ2620563.1 Golgi transport complex subunit 6 [Coemansia sp. RSA 1358]KAJ2673584.1 Golgi transport complex subunit 6 [Coemansia spiralis]